MESNLILTICLLLCLITAFAGGATQGGALLAAALGAGLLPERSLLLLSAVAVLAGGVLVGAPALLVQKMAMLLPAMAIPVTIPLSHIALCLLAGQAACLLLAMVTGRTLPMLAPLAAGSLALSPFLVATPDPDGMAWKWLAASLVLPLLLLPCGLALGHLMDGILMRRVRPRDRLAWILPLEMGLLGAAALALAGTIAGLSGSVLITAMGVSFSLLALGQWIAIRHRPFWVANDRAGMEMAHRPPALAASLILAGLATPIGPLASVGLLLHVAQRETRTQGLAGFLTGTSGAAWLMLAIILTTAAGTVLAGYRTAHRLTGRLGKPGAVGATLITGTTLAGLAPLALLSMPVSASPAAAGTGAGIAMAGRQRGAAYFMLIMLAEWLGLLGLAALVTLALFGMMRAITG